MKKAESKSTGVAMAPNVTDSLIMLKSRAEWPDPSLDKAALIARVESIVDEQLGNAFEFSQPTKQGRH